MYLRDMKRSIMKVRRPVDRRWPMVWKRSWSEEMMMKGTLMGSSIDNWAAWKAIPKSAEFDPCPHAVNHNLPYGY